MSKSDYSRRFDLTLADMFAQAGKKTAPRRRRSKPLHRRRILTEIVVEVVTYKLHQGGPGAYALRALTPGGVIVRTAYFSKVTGRDLDLASVTAAFSLVAPLRGLAGYDPRHPEGHARLLNNGRAGTWRASDEKTFTVPRMRRFRLIFPKGTGLFSGMSDEALDTELCALLARQTFEKTANA